MAVNKNLLLFIEPKNPPSIEPLVDVLTCTMTAAFRKAESGTSNYSDTEGPYVFREGSGYRGIHLCSCGVNAGNRVYKLPNGEITNKLAIHYLAYHRDEISEEQLKRVDVLIDDVHIPTNEELAVPKGSEELDLDKINRPKKKPIRISEHGDKCWTVGFRDRGMGHGDFCVMEEDDTLIAEITLNEGNDVKNAHLIVEACNHHKELIALCEEALGMVQFQYDIHKIAKIEKIRNRLTKIKKVKVK